MEEKGFFNVLFDLSFSEFITKRVIKALFVLAIIISAVAAIAILVGGISRGGLGILGGIVLAPIAFVIYVLVARVWLELILVLFRISDNIDRLAEQKKSTE